MNLTDKSKVKTESNEDKKYLIEETRIKLSEEELSHVAGGFSNPVELSNNIFECSKGGAYDIESSGIL